MDTRHALISDILFGLRHRLTEWEKAEADRLETRKHVTALVGEPWIVRIDNFAYTVKGNICYAGVLPPSLIGVSHYTRKDAETIASLRGHECKLSHCNDVRREVIEELKVMITQLEDILVS